MNDQDALLALAVGDDAERDQAKQWLLERYHARLVGALEKQFWADQDYASIGAADAFQELFENAETVVPKLEGKTGQPWGWLLLRASDRARDEQRRAFRTLRCVPDDQKQGLARHDASVLANHESDDDPVEVAQDNETGVRLRFAVFEFAIGLEDEIDRHIFLHDCVNIYHCYSEEEAEKFDSDLLARRPEDIYTKGRLKKRRQRIRIKLREFLIVRRIP